MKIIALLLLILAGGCTITRLDPETRKFSRWSILQRIEFREIVVGTNGTVTIKGYQTDGGNDAAAQITAAAVSAAVKGMKP